MKDLEQAKARADWYDNYLGDTQKNKIITRVTIELDIDSDSYGDRSDLESLVIDELSDLMRSDIMAGARVDTIPTIWGARMDIVPND
jgi:hypothetical protein